MNFIHRLGVSCIIMVALLTATPALGQGACCMPGAACTQVPDEATCNALGGVVLVGEDCATDPCEAGACCNGTNCLIADAFSCIAGGRDFAGAGVTCLADPCEADIGACCLPGDTCAEVSSDACDGMGGTWQGAGAFCVNDPCSGGCCLPGDCLDVDLADCMIAGGQFNADVSCVADACEVPGGCPTNALYSQARDQPALFTALVSESSAGVQRWDDYADAAGAIEGLRWWGIDARPSGGGFVECVEINNLFEIAFHEDDGGSVGSVVCQATLLATRTPTGLFYGGFELNQYEVTLGTPCVLAEGWLSIVGLGDPDCWFLWMGSPDGNGISFCTGCVDPDEPKDASFCLLGSAGGVFGACCDYSTGFCVDGVAIADCLATGLRFEVGVTCVSLDPPCVITSGACCLPGGGCVVDVPVDCVVAGGDWLGPGTTCMQCPEIGACCLGADVCLVMTEVDCDIQGWTWLGAGTTCDECPSQPECPPDTMFGQPPDDAAAFEVGTSEVSTVFRRYDDYAGLPGDVVAVTWWGLNLDNLGGSNWVPCEDLNATFEISFHADAGGMPGVAVCDHSVVATRTPLGLFYYGIELLEYSVTLPAPCSLADGWVSVAGAGDTECWFLWMSSNFGQGGSWCDGCVPPDQFSDFSVCLRNASAACPADTDGNGQVDVVDLLNVILDWGTDGSGHGGDTDASGTVDVVDLLAVILAWGGCP